MKITKDSVGNVILNDGSHRVVLSAALVQAIGEQVYADSPRAECEGRMVVVALPSVKVAIRPGKEPTVANEDLNWRCWRYTTPDGQLLEHEAFIRSDWKGETWSGIVGLQSFPDEYSPPGPATRKHIQERIEAVLAAEGYEIVDAGDAQAIAHPASSLPVCPSCLVPGELVSVQSAGPECALSCPKCGAGWSEELSGEVIETLLGTEEEPTTGYGAFPGGDPRLFDPDPECSTPEEREAHRKACQEADAMEARGEVPDWPSAHSFGQVGNFGVHIASSMFGLGTYAYEEAPDER